MISVQRERVRLRMVRHHLPLLVVSALSAGLLYETRPYKDVLSRASFATAYPALALLAVTLLIGPWNVVMARRNPISGDLRRDCGIWAGALSVVHALVGQCVHLRGRPWLYYVYARKEHHSFPLRYDLFGFANYTGLLGVLMVMALLATSNDLSLRALGTPRWKGLQRWNYAAFALAAAHTIAYQRSEKLGGGFVVVAVVQIGVVMVLQAVGYVRRRAVLRGGSLA